MQNKIDDDDENTKKLKKKRQQRDAALGNKNEKKVQRTEHHWQPFCVSALDSAVGRFFFGCSFIRSSILACWSVHSFKMRVCMHTLERLLQFSGFNELFVVWCAVLLFPFG